MNAQVEDFFGRTNKWSKEFHLLRAIVTQNKSLKEEYKWMHPCYTLEGKNVVLIHGFKEYCALLFHKGTLMTDTAGILVQQTANVQSARQIRFTTAEQIAELEPFIKDYIKEAVEIEKSGKQVEMKKLTDYPIPKEFQAILAEDKALAKAFNSLTSGRQKAYLFYFNQAKQSKTREARIQKYHQRILDHKGIDDE
ncbi:YdeI/OmpD-associated family protein [Pedobacter heparinus]|uniref:YdeI/OmpD-associated family protein n=1 Tax=Pedobacter heparinus TaxID=984 RepID=UPI00292D3313|nr:YdeI/OmpD-associated family protein [Pedobacter heparinus]